MANFWDNDEIVTPAPAVAESSQPAHIGATPAPSTPSTAPAISPAAPAEGAALASAPKAFWEDDEIVKPAPSKPPQAAPVEAVAPPAQPERSVLGQVGHSLGLAGRAAVNAVAAPVAMVADAVAAPVNAGLALYDKVREPTAHEQASGVKQNGFRFPGQAQALNTVMDAAGVAKPENSVERVAQDVAAGAGAAMTGMGIGGVLAKSAGPLSRAVGAMLTAAPEMQIASGAASGAASGLTREGGGGAVAQGVAGLAGALAPTGLPFVASGAMRGALRGGASRQTVADNIQTFENASGSVPTLGQATGSRAIQGAETGLTNVIGGGGIMARRGERQAEELAHSVRSLSSALSPNASGADAGESIAKGMSAFKDHMKVTQKYLYSELDKHIPDATPIGVSRTQHALQALNEDIPGAPNISAFFRNAKLNSIDRALLADLDAAATAQVPAGMSSSGLEKMPGQLPYEAIKKLRTLVGAEISNNSLVADVPRSKWRAVYAALSEDLGDAAQQAGPRAEQLWSRANKVTSLSMQRMDQLDGIVSRDVPERIFSAATSGMAEGGTTITRIMKSLPVENRRDVAAAVLQRMGRAKPANQDAMAEKFSSETFLTNLAGMSPPARRAVFGSSGFPGLEEKVKQLGLMAGIRRDGSSVFANPSGTARQTGLIAWWASLGMALTTGNLVAASALLGGVATAKAGAKVVTSPWVVKQAARETTLNSAFAPAALAATVGMSPDSQPKSQPEGQVFKNRLQAGHAARLAGGSVVRVEGGFVVQPQR